MRGVLIGLSMLAMACSTDTFEVPDGSADGGDDGIGGGDAGAADAPFDVASCAPTWCASNPAQQGSLCTDFDESSSLPSDWQLEVTNGNVTLVSSPAEHCLSLRSHVAQVTGTSGGARINHSTPVSGTSTPHATLALDVMLPTSDVGGTVFYFAIRMGTLSIGLVQRADGNWYLQSSLGTNTLTSALASQGPVRGAFTHMVLDVMYQASAVTATLTYRRADNNTDTVNANGAAITVASTISFLAGINATTATNNAVDAYYDDVVATQQ